MPSAARSICLLTNRLDRAGAEMQVALLAAGLARRGWRTSVVSMAEPRALPDPLVDGTVPVHDLGLSKAATTPIALARLVRHLRQERPQVLHAHLFHANLAARLVRLVHRIPVVVCTAHSVREGGAWRDRAYRLTDSLASCTTAVGEAVAERQRAAGVGPPGKLRVVPNGIDVATFAPDPAARNAARAALGVGSRFVWLHLARFVRAKNHTGLLEAWRRVAVPDRVLLLAGEGPLEEAARAQSERLRLAESVVFLGSRDDVPNLLQASDACVSSSEWEGLPMALLEAGASARPVVATSVGGCGEVVDDGITGLLVPPGDPGELAAAMEQLMARSVDARAQIGAAARVRVSTRFSLESILDQWESLYEEMGRGTLVR